MKMNHDTYTLIFCI